MSTRESQVHLDIGSRFENIDLVQIVMETSLRQLDFDEQTSHRIGLSVREAVANAIKHGNRQDPNKRVSIELDVSNDQLMIKVSDEGDGFDPGELPDPLSKENLLRPNGRGILFMKSFMDEIDYSFVNNKGMVVTMRKSLKASAANPRELEEKD